MARRVEIEFVGERLAVARLAQAYAIAVPERRRVTHNERRDDERQGLADGRTDGPGGGDLREVRREALCCIPGSAGRNSKEGSWVQWLTRIRKVKGTAACQESGGQAQVSGLRCRETRVIWRKLNCLNPNLQTMQRSVRRKDTCYRCRALRRHLSRVVATFGAWSVAQ